MTSSAPPPTRPSLLALALQGLVRVSLWRPGLTVLLALAASASGVFLAATQLEFKTSRLDLLNPRSEFNQRWLRYLEEFGDGDDAVLVAEGQPLDAQAAIDACCQLLAAPADVEDEAFSSGAVLGQIDLTRLEPHGLHLLEAEQAWEIWSAVGKLPQRESQWEQLDAVHLLRQVEREAQLAARAGDGRQPLPAETADRAERLLRALGESLSSSDVYLSPWPADISWNPQLQPRRLAADRERLQLALVRVDRAEGVPRAGQLRRIRRTLDAVRRGHPHVRVGLTGIPVLEQDEMASSQQDMAKSSAISLLGVGILFAAAFGGLRHPLLAVASLLVALGWTCGYITLTIGHLNILSVAFGAILIGLGIDFGIHLIADYVQQPSAVSSADALTRSAGRVGPGIVTGGLTTALAFCTAALTDFKGVAELGLIASGGILLCVASALLLLPALILLVDRRRSAELPPPLPSGVLSAPARLYPRLTLLSGLAITSVMAGGLWEVRYDHNLLNLQPQAMESVVWEHRLARASNQSAWYALSVAADQEDLLQRQAAFQQLPSVERTESLAPLLYRADPQRSEALLRIRQWCEQLPPRAPALAPPPVESVNRQLLALQDALVAHGDLASLAEQTRQRLRQLATDDAAMRMGRWQQQAIDELFARLSRLADAARAAPPTLDDIPPELRSRFLAADGGHLIQVYARDDIWDMPRLERFVREVESVDPQCTGHPVQTFYASRQMLRSFVHAGIYSFLAVSAVLMLDFRSLRLTALALAPMLLGMVQLFGLLGLLSIPLNAANMIVLPLIMGIGIDDGVHVVHDYLRQRGGGRPYRMGDATATAVLVTSATTMVGFGSMMVASHQGLRSLGQVLTLGVFCCLVTSLWGLPALLTWIGKRQGRA